MVEYTGRTEIINHKLKLKCILEFKPYSYFRGQINRVEGYICDANENKLALLAGKWDSYFYATNDIENSGKKYIYFFLIRVTQLQLSLQKKFVSHVA